MKALLVRLLNWVLGWLVKEAVQGAIDLYRPAERTIYHYWDGESLISADPMILYKKIMARGPELSIDIKVAASASKGAGPAHDNMIRKLRDVFGVKPLAEGGLPEQEVIDLFDHFMFYCESIKKNSRPPPTSPEPTSPPTPPPTAPASGGSSEPAPPTSPSSDSGSTGNEPTIDNPTTSPSA